MLAPSSFILSLPPSLPFFLSLNPVPVLPLELVPSFVVLPSSPFFVRLASSVIFPTFFSLPTFHFLTKSFSTYFFFLGGEGTRFQCPLKKREVSSEGLCTERACLALSVVDPSTEHHMYDDANKSKEFSILSSFLSFLIITTSGTSSLTVRCPA